MNAIETATSDPRNTELMKHISNHCKIQYQKSKGDCWSSNLKNGTCYIDWLPCSEPAAALAHELLHIDTQLKGFKRIKYGISKHAHPKPINILRMCLDNELQHHKFYKDFIILGYAPATFYCDSDKEIESYLNNLLTAQYNNPIQPLLGLFTLIAPGGSIYPHVKENLFQKFCNLNDGAYKDLFHRVRTVCESWALSASYDNIPVIKDIMLALYPKPNSTWFSYTEKVDFPKSGFFVDQVFEVETEEPPKSEKKHCS